MGGGGRWGKGKRKRAGGGAEDTGDEREPAEAHRQQTSRGWAHEEMEHMEETREDRQRRRGGGARETEREARERGTRSGDGIGDTVRQSQEQVEASMRPTETGTVTPAAEEPVAGCRRTRGARTNTREEADGGADAATHGEKRCREDAQEEEEDGMESENGTRETQEKEIMNVNSRPKRKCNLRIVNEQKEQRGRKGTGRGARRGAAGRIRYIGSGAGTGRVPLAQAIVVGRVCVVRTARMGEIRTDAGRPRPDPG